jgi:hypothetical protein
MHSYRVIGYWIGFVVLLAVAVRAHAQQPAKSAEEKDKAIREQSIYIPYDKLRKTFEAQGRGVFLPYEKFQELWKAAQEKIPAPVDSGPPVQAVITQIENEARVERDVVRVSAKVTIDLLQSGWIEVPLRLNDAAVLSARIDGQPALLVGNQDGGQKLILKNDKDEPRQISLELEYAKSISKEPGINSVAFEAPLAPVNRWRIQIPESGVKVNVFPTLAATEEPLEHRTRTTALQANGSDPTAPHPADDGTVVLAFVGAAPTVRIDWTPKAEGASGLDALVGVQTEQQIAIDEGLTRTRARLRYEISRAELSELAIEVPADQKVVNVSDANIRQWNMVANGDAQTIHIRLFQPANTEQSVNLELEKLRDTREGEVNVPTIKALNVGRQRGLLVVQLAEGLRAEPSKSSGLQQVDDDEMPEALKGARPDLAFRYATLPFDLTLNVDAVEPRIHVEQLVEAFLQPRKLTVALLAKYNIERAGLFELAIDLPEGFEVRRVQGRECSGAAAVSVESHTVEQKPTGSKLKVNLANKASGSVALLVELERRVDDANLLSPTGQASQLQISPPRVSEDSVQRSAGYLVVYAPESLRIAVDQLDGLRNVAFEEAFKSIPSVRDDRFADVRPVQAFAFSDAAAMAQFSAQRRQPQVSIRQLLISRVEPGAIKYEALFFYDIRYSAVKELRIDIPAAVAARIRNESSSLRESSITPPPGDLAAEYVAWNLTGETELLGNVQCKLTWETPIEDLGIGKSIDITVPRLIPRGADRADGQIVLVKAETIDVEPKGVPQGLDSIDPQHDLMAGTQIDDAAAALEFHGDWSLTLTATRYDLQVLKQTSIEQAVVRQVITRSDRVSVQALYRMRSNRQRLVIELPGDVAAGEIEFDTDPLRINGRRVSLERGDGPSTFYVPLVGHDSNEPFLLELRYTAPGDGERLSYPTFPDEPAVQKVNVVAYVPDELAYLGRRGPWTDEIIWTTHPAFRRVPVPRVNIAGLIGELTRGIEVSGNPAEDFPTDGLPLLFSTLRPESPDTGALRLTTVHRQMLNGAVFGFIALGGVLLLRRPVAERFAVVCALLAVLVLIGTFLPALLSALLGQVLMLAVLAVVLVWAAVFAVRTVPRLARMRLRFPRRPRSSGAEAGDPQAAPPALASEAGTPPNTSGGQNDR